MFEQPKQCVHIGDRESDIYELFCQTHDVGAHFFFRTCADRLTGDGTCAVKDYMQQVCRSGLHHVQVRDSKGDCRLVMLERR